MKRIVIIFMVLVFFLLLLRVLTSTALHSYLRGKLPFTRSLSSVSIWSNVSGPEDIEIVRDRGLLIISSEDRRGNGKAVGSLYAMDVTKPIAKQQPERLSCDYPPQFRPHGISLRKNGGNIEIYAISHRDGGSESVEVFSLEGPNNALRLRYLRTIPFNDHYRPNDLTVLNDGTFFLSCDSDKSKPAFLSMLFSLRFSPLMYYDGVDFHLIRQFDLMGNGITHRVENGKLVLYRADTLLNRVDVLVMKKDGQSYSVVSSHILRIPFSPDNLTFDEKGRLYTACHYSFSKFIAHSKGKSPSPTLIYRVNTNDVSTPIYANDGSEYSAASVAVPVGDRIYLGDVFDSKILSGLMTE